MGPGRRVGRVRVAIAWLGIGALLASSCATPSVPPTGAGVRPLPPDAEKEETALLERVRTYDDPMLEEYLGRIGGRLGAAGVRFVVLRDPTLNAFAMPNGRIYVHTGLLARVENEAQLAAVLAHETTHLTNGDALRVERGAPGDRTAPALAAAIDGAAAAGVRVPQADDIGAAVISPTAGAVLGLGLGLATLAAIDGYGRDLERAADRGGMEKMIAAGYDVRETPRVFEVLQKEAKESGDGGSLEIFFFGNPARLQDRIDNANALLRSAHADALRRQTPTRDTEDFRLRMRAVVRDNAHEELRAGRFAFAQAQLDRVLGAIPGDALARVYYGDLYRLRAQRARTVADRDALAKKALEQYELAARVDPALPEPHRQLGFLYYQERDNARAKEAFEKYLALRPDAPDAARVREYLAALDR